MRIITFVTGTAPILSILRHIWEPDLQPIIAPAREPTIFDLEFDQAPNYELSTVEPEYKFDQRVEWVIRFPTS